MIAVTSPRRSYQRHVAQLLDEIDRRRYELLLLRANGARPAGLRELKAKLRTARRELAAAVAASSHRLPAQS